TGKSDLAKVPQGIRVDDKTGKPIGIHLMIGRRPTAAFWQLGGDQEMLEYAQDGGGARLMVLVHDDATREYAYGPGSKIGTFSDDLMAGARSAAWRSDEERLEAHLRVGAVADLEPRKTSSRQWHCVAARRAGGLVL